jgi:hypothetical protein
MLLAMKCQRIRIRLHFWHQFRAFVGNAHMHCMARTTSRNSGFTATGAIWEADWAAALHVQLSAIVGMT